MNKYKKCGNQFREFFKENAQKFVLSAHKCSLGKIRMNKQTADRHKNPPITIL
jgi:hypothetical protein